MIAVDTNLLIYAHREDTDFHDRVIGKLRELAESGLRWAIPWPCPVRVPRHHHPPRIFDPPSPAPLALRAKDVWLSSPASEMLGEGPGYFDTLKGIVTKGRTSGAAVHEARIAALCIHHGVRELWTADRDFSRFPELGASTPTVIRNAIFIF